MLPTYGKIGITSSYLASLACNGSLY